MHDGIHLRVCKQTPRDQVNGPPAWKAYTESRPIRNNSYLITTHQNNKLIYEYTALEAENNCITPNIM